MWVDDTEPHELPVSYVKEIREDKSDNKGGKVRGVLLVTHEMTQWK